MSRVKLAMAAAFAAVALSAVMAGSASAQWLVNGTNLTTSAAIASLPLIDSTPILHVPSLAISISCESIHLFGGKILPPDLVFIKEILFLKCRTIPPTNTKCQLEGGIVNIPATGGGTGLLGLATLTLIAHGKAESGKLFATIPFEEVGCAIAGAQPVKGEVNLGAQDNNTDKVEHLVTGLGEGDGNNSLEVGSNKAILLGAILVGLVGNPTWAFH